MRPFRSFRSFCGASNIARIRVVVAERFAVPVGDHGSGHLRFLHRSRAILSEAAARTRRRRARPQNALLVKIDRRLVEALDDLLARAFAEDGEDITTLAVFGPKARVAGDMVCREAAVVAGAAFLPRVFAFLHPRASVEVLVGDGDAGRPGNRPRPGRRARPSTVLAAERTALNLVQRLTGHRDGDAGLRRRSRRDEPRASSTRARRRPACAPSRSTRCAAAAARTTGWGSPTPSS
ncbi:MAG: hypothetical protein M0C28_16070 [Candidatus Moduliflexus flocculans]|nr:hypothetical protein [Candidatus Moduliflexus flocculans]